MPKVVTKYDLLISCPSDVKDEIDIIRETIDEYNRRDGEKNNTVITTKHWSKDSYPQSGGRPQELLNKQFVLDCDFVVAVFWTRFGTPTEKYGSGTEEEIEELIKSGKQVFLYFSDQPIKPSLYDSSQYKKVIEFREKYKDRGIYDIYETSQEFEKKFSNHLKQYFDSIPHEKQEKPQKGQLVIQGVDGNGKPTDRPKLFRTQLGTQLLNLEFFKQDKEEILSLFEKIDNIRLSGINKSYHEAIEIPEKNKKILCDYASDHNININMGEFFHLGNLGGVKNIMTLGGYSVKGTEEEKRKYLLIQNLLTAVNKLEDYINYFSNMDSKYFLKLCLSNQGTRPDEDIEVRLLFEKDVLCKKEELPFPGIDIIKGFDGEALSGIYKAKKSVSVREYENMITSFDHGLKYTIEGRTPTYEEQEEINRKNYFQEINNIFIYDYYSEGDMDIICYTQNYIKHNTNIYLPSKLVFNSPPDKIRYEIRSKNSPEIMKGEIDIKSD